MHDSRSVVNFPELGELVVGTITKIMPYGVFCRLEEYGIDGFVHVSELSSTWVKNIRSIVKEGQRVVLVVINVEKQKNQVDLSLKKVSENDRKRKMESFTREKKSLKMLERIGVVLNKKTEVKQIEAKLSKEYGDVYSALEKIKQGESPDIPKNWFDELLKIAKLEFKERKVTVKAKVELKSMESDGVERIRKTLKSIQSLGGEVVYLGAPNYLISKDFSNHKEGEKFFSKIEAMLSKSGLISNLEVVK
jgi:translation initiation factor 2 subunit 1